MKRWSELLEFTALKQVGIGRGSMSATRLLIYRELNIQCQHGFSYNFAEVYPCVLHLSHGGPEQWLNQEVSAGIKHQNVTSPIELNIVF